MRRRIYNHIIFWMLCLSLEAYAEVSWINVTYTELPFWKCLLNAFIGESILMTIKIPIIYLSFKLIKRFTIDRKRYMIAFSYLLAIFLIGAMASHLLLVKFIFPYVYHDYLYRPIFSDRISISFIDIVFIASIANAIKQYRYQIELRDNERTLIQEKLTAELIFLKAQLNPHFLFNTLNNLYGLARKKSDQTADVILKLSSLLRFILYEAEKKYILVIQEILILEHYIELERIRYDDNLIINFKKQLSSNEYSITPLLLLPFVENAFKHGASEVRDKSFIHIYLQLKENGAFLFEVKNNTEEEVTHIVENIGLKNIRRQLELVHPNHELEISTENKIFTIRLKIQLTLNDKI